MSTAEYSHYLASWQDNGASNLSNSAVGIPQTGSINMGTGGR